jgi:capsular polysaccharide biosynthesis protein
VKSAQSPFQAVVKLLLRWWWLILLSVALGGGAGYLVRSRQPNIYFAKTTILFGQNFTTGASANQTSLTQLRDIIYSGLVRRPNILEPVIDELRLGIGVDQLNQVMSVNIVENLPLMEITIADTDPARASNIANRIAQELIIQSPTEQVSQETEFRRAQLRDLQKQIEELQREYDVKVALGANFTSAFEIAQNLSERASILENLKELRLIYAEMSSGLADQVNFLRIYEFANPDALPVVTSSILSVVLLSLIHI